MAEHSIWGQEETHQHWRDVAQIEIPRCTCGELVGVHFGQLGRPPYLYCRGMNRRNCGFFATVSRVQSLNNFLLAEPIGGNDIHCAYMDGVRRQTGFRMRGDFDQNIIVGLFRSFFSAARSRPAVGYSTRIPIRIPHFFERLADAVAFSRIVFGQDNNGETRTVDSVRRLLTRLFGAQQFWQ